MPPKKGRGKAKGLGKAKGGSYLAPTHHGTMADGVTGVAMTIITHADARVKERGNGTAGRARHRRKGGKGESRDQFLGRLMWEDTGREFRYLLEGLDGQGTS